MIYLDHAATTKISPAARDAMIAALDTYGNPSSVHTLGQQASAELGRARETIARQLGASPREIYFTSGGSEGDNQALLTGAKNGAAAGMKHIISTAMEHHAVLHTPQLLLQLLGGILPGVGEKQETLVVPFQPVQKFLYAGQKPVAVVDHAVHVADKTFFLKQFFHELHPSFPFYFAFIIVEKCKEQFDLLVKTV